MWVVVLRALQARTGRLAAVARIRTRMRVSKPEALEPAALPMDRSLQLVAAVEAEVAQAPAVRAAEVRAAL